jgi:RimJ/RimL family protein N-acetyltransferase
VSDTPFLTTERLELWLPRAGDREELRAVATGGDTGRFLAPDSGEVDFFNRFMRGSGSWQLYGYGLLPVRLRGEPAIVGNCGVFHTLRGLGEDFDDQPEAGWIIRHDHVGKGFAGEAMRAVLDWFDRAHGPRRIVCMISPGNEPSIRLADKLGFAPYRDAELPTGDAVRLFERAPG